MFFQNFEKLAVLVLKNKLLKNAKNKKPPT